jgi:hypothetical protein
VAPAAVERPGAWHRSQSFDATERLGFYDLHSQSYGEANPTPEAGEFQIGDYGAGGSPGQAGEFKVTLIELANGGRWGLYPHLEVQRSLATARRRCARRSTPASSTFSVRLAAVRSSPAG